MSQEDRLSGGPLREEFGFLEQQQQQRSCRCAGGPGGANPGPLPQEQACQSGPDVADHDGFGVDVEDSPDPQQNQQQHQHRLQEVGFERFSGLRGSAVELQSVLAGVNFTVDGDDRFVNGNQKIMYTGNCEPENVAEDEAEDSSVKSSDRHVGQIHPGLDRIHSGTDRSPYDEENPRDRSSVDPADRGSSPIARTDDRPGTAASSASFATSMSSNEANSARSHGRADNHPNDAHNRSQSNVHRQPPIVNAFDNGRSSRDRMTRENNRANVDGNPDAEDPHLGPPGSGNLGSYSPAFRGLHGEHILQPIHRQANVGPKGTFDNIQISASNTLEKGKCQCHHIQQHHHQHQQRLPSVQQRDQIHTHHHHQHRHKSMLPQQQQQRSQSQQQQHYRHHHYHHPHQHIGQQQDLQRHQSDQLVGRNKHGGAGPEDDSGEMMETGMGTHQPPALPPRPPPRPSRRYEQNAIAAYDLGPNNGEDAGCCKKYVVLCCLCGGLSAAVGSLFLAVHAVLSAHTASLALFETVPSWIPGTMLILMGLFTILLARRKHRYGFLMKMCGSIGVVCALVCVLVTVTTTVVHMSRLQGLRECIYTEIARSCTCYGASQGKVSGPGVLFEETAHCEVVHGALYDCLRALFGVSVAGILACIFSCMLLYQLLSHEKKKMYWEQLQLRCRSLYGQGGTGAAGGAAGGSCGCCNDCGGASPWWAQTPGNLYTPNPDLAPFRRWRLPWSRSRGPAPTPDSNYGFHTQSRGAVVMRSSGSSGDAGDNTPGPYSVLTDDSQTGTAPYSLLNGTNNAPYAACASSVASYSLLENGPLPALWGPPPPYSDPNSPARRPQLAEDRRPPTSARPPPPTAPTSTPVNVSTNRIANKRTIDNFETGSCEEYRQRGTPKRPSDNYENAEEVLAVDPEMEMGNLHQHHPHHHHPQLQQDEDAVKGRRVRKSLKGVENSGFQQESGNGLSKQSESELYFGDVSSCCGPESSFYDLALEKEQQSAGAEPGESLLEYPTPSRLGKHQRQSSKRSRLPLPLPALNSEGSVASLTDNYAALNNPVGVDEVGRNSSTRGPFLAPDAQYEVIAQQTRYTYYNPKSGEHVLEIPLPSLASLAYRNSSKDQLDDIGGPNAGDYHNDCQRVPEHCAVDGASSSTTVAPSPSPSDTSLPPTPVSHTPTATQRCTNDPGVGVVRDNAWQTDQSRSQSGEGVCPVNV